MSENLESFSLLWLDRSVNVSQENIAAQPKLRAIINHLKTFENAEELTDEGLPFLILFHKADDQESVALFEREVAKQLLNERSNINCLHADGAQFIHPLQHLGKSLSDLPLLAIDSFKHMFLFPDIKLYFSIRKI
ncbi:unnamed protein product [Rotaria sp. Silwood1]|nr:unnamed protein product [Rotaria sp. Silwood1]